MATLAAGAGGFALLTRKAEGEFETELSRVPNTRSTIEDARSRMVTYAALTDALTVGSLVAGGVALYLGLSEGRPASKEVAARPRRPGISLSPTPAACKQSVDSDRQRVGGCGQPPTDPPQMFGRCTGASKLAPP